MTAILLPSHQLSAAELALRAGDVVAIPTETVYGLAADATNAQAVTRIFSAKDRPLFDPLIVHIPRSWGSLQKLDEHGVVDLTSIPTAVREHYETLMTKFWPGPLTLLFPRGARIPDLVTSGLPTVGIRMPNHPVALALLEALQKPLAAPSANRFGRISPTSSDHVRAELGDRIPFIIDGGNSEVGVESTVAAVSEGRIQILRPGKVGAADFKRALPKVSVEVISNVLDQHTASSAPGQLASHYAPRKPLYLFDHALPQEIPADKRLGLLSFSDGGMDTLNTEFQSRLVSERIVLSKDENPEEVARKVFASLRQLDESAADVIVSESPTHTEGLWHAITDRLRRASHI